MKPPIAADPENEWGDELLQSALKLLRAPGNQDAAATIRYVAQAFTDDLKQSIAAPRIAHLKKKLTEISQHSSGLARELDEVDPFFVETIFAYTSADDWPHGLSEFRRPLIDESTRLKAMLSGITKGADLVIKKMPKDKGSPGTLFDILQQPPKRLFTGRCWEMFWQFRPGEARGTIDGDFYIYCGLLYNLATGEDPDEEGSGAGLIRYVREVAKACNELLERKPAIDHLRRALADGQSAVGLITGTGLFASLFGSPQQLHQLSSTKSPEKHRDR